MTKIGDSLRPSWMPGINEIESGIQQSFKGWLEDENYVFSDLDPPTSTFDLAPVDEKALASSFALDVDRFASACLETFAGIPSEKEVGQSRAWSLIRAYYAAFFAAHGFCRLFGRSISHLDKGQVDALRRSLKDSGYPDGTLRFFERNYVFSYKRSAGVLTATPLNAGSHEDMWTEFECLLRELQDEVLKGGGATLIKQQVFDCIEVVRGILNTDRSSGNWLSKIRNNLNYRHDYGAWFPHGDGRHWTEVDGLLRSFLMEPIIGSFAQESKIIVRFTKGCALIVGMFFDVVRDIARRHPSNKSFLAPKTGAIFNIVKGPL